MYYYKCKNTKKKHNDKKLDEKFAIQGFRAHCGLYHFEICFLFTK